MGNYNSEYESYYKTMVNKGKVKSYSNLKKTSNGRRSKGISISFVSNLFSKQKIFRRILQELIGGLVLFSVLIFCKSNVWPQSKNVYNFSKQVVTQNLDFKELSIDLGKIRNFKLDNFQTVASNFIENIKISIAGGQSVEEKIKANYIIPTRGKITTTFSSQSSNKEGVDIDAKENSDVACSFGGKVKEIGENTIIGKYVVIDHGEGVITKYSNLNEQIVKKDEIVDKGQIIGKSGKAGKSTGPHLHYEIIYMGTEIDPQEYINLSI